MSIPSFEFLLAVPVLVTVMFLISSPRLRQWLLAACNLAFVAATFTNNATFTSKGSVVWSVVALAAFSLSGYFAARILRAKPSGAILTAYLSLLVAAFLLLKKYVFLGMFLPGWVMEHPISVIGLSYILFRQIHFVVDAMQQQIPEFSLWSYLNYQFNLFGFLSGPIQRYQEFDEKWREMRPMLSSRHEILRAYLRLFVGIIKVSVISVIFLYQYQRQSKVFTLAGGLEGLDRRHVLMRFAVVLYSYPLFLYFNFSGYCDVVIAAAALLGMKMPENFDRPYLSRNVIDYWTRFHRSLGFWIRDYLFTPMYKAAATRWPGGAAWWVFPCYLVAFVLAGVWHGSTTNFVVFGLIHGCGVGAVKLWEMYLIKRIGRKGLKEYLASWPIRVPAIALTLTFISFAMLFFPIPLEKTFDMLHNFGHAMRS